VSRPPLLRTSLILLALQSVFRVGDGLFPLLLAAWFGRSTHTDVYFFAWAAFSLAGSVVFAIFQDSAVVPILTEVRLLSPNLLARVVGSLLAHTVVVGGALAAVVGVGALGFFAVRYEGEDLALAARMVPVFSLVLVAMGLRTLLAAVLVSHQRFIAAPIASAIGICVTIAIVALGRARGVGVVPIASLAGELVAVAVLAWVAFGPLGLEARWTFERPEPVRRFAKLAGAEAIGGALVRVNAVADQLVASIAGVVGGGTLLRYSSDVALVPTSLLASSLLPVLLSHLSADAAVGDAVKVRATVRRSLFVVVGILGAAAILMWLVSAPLLRFIYLRGAMDPSGVDRMVRLMPYHLVGLASFGALLVLAKAHVSLKNSGIMIGMGALNASLNLFFDVILAKAIGLEGIALATSCVHTAIAIVFWVRFETKVAHLKPVNAAGAEGHG
jgi:putative peptidoglycan lipid II flippase